MSYYTWQQFCISEKKSNMNNIFSAVWGLKENFHFYSQAICCHCCWRCRNNTGVRAKNKTAVYLPLPEPKKWYAQRSDAAVCFAQRCHCSLYLVSHSLLLRLLTCLCCFFWGNFGVVSLSLAAHCMTLYTVLWPIQVWVFIRRLFVDKTE